MSLVSCIDCEKRLDSDNVEEVFFVDGKDWTCFDCMDNAGLAVCEGCNIAFEKREMLELKDGSFKCRECEPDTSKCRSCDKVKMNDEFAWIDEDAFCLQCKQEQDEENDKWRDYYMDVI